MAQAPATAPMDAAPPLKEGWTTVDVSTVSADDLIGFDIQTYDQETVASIKDVLLDPAARSRTSSPSSAASSASATAPCS